MPNHDAAWRAAVSAKLRGLPKSPEHREKLSKAMRGKGHGPAWRTAVSRKLRGWPKPRGFGAKVSLALKGRKKTPEHRAAVSAAKKGRRTNWRASLQERERRRQQMLSQRRLAPDLFTEWQRKGAEAAGRGQKAHEFLDRLGRLWRMRSRWEVEAAMALDRAGVSWFYEPCELLLSNGYGYIPDFWVPEWGTYVEVKGWPPPRRDKVAIALADGLSVLKISNLRQIRQLSSRRYNESAEGKV